MAQPIWNTTAGSIGSYPALLAMLYQLSATAVAPATSITYQILSGELPSGLAMTSAGLISGTPTLVTSNTTSTFAVRATDNLGNVRDRTFLLTISGSAIPQFTTPNGSLINTYPTGGTIDSVWVSIPVTYSNPSTSNPVIVQVKEGTLPPGLEIDLLGNIRGYAKPPTITITTPSVVTNATETSSTGNVITVTSTVGFIVGRPIVFSGSSFGDINTGQQYYIKTIPSSTTFTVSETQNGDIYALLTGSGFMTATLPAISTGSPTIRTYSFTLELDSPLGGDTGSYSITVVNQNTPTSQGGPGYTPNTRYPVVLNTRPLTFNLNDTDPYFGYYILPPIAPSQSAFMGNFQSGEYFAFKVIGHDFDGNTIGYDFVGLPSELTGDVQTGWITGYPSLESTGISRYSFSVSVYKTGKPEYASPFFNFAYNLEKDITSTIVWISDSDLGQIFNGTISTSAVVAESDVELSYRITSGSLPPNLTLSSNGEIIGRVADQPTNTLLDQGDTTEFTFTVQAYSPIFPAVGSSKSFTLTVLQEFSQPTDTLYIQATPSINDRQLLASLLDNDTLIPPNALYRSNDQYFGKATSVIYEHAYGIYASDIEEYIVAVTRNHYWRNITLGELKTAVAKNSAGDIIYEVVYSEVIDNLVNPQGVSIQEEIVWPRPIDLGLGPWYTSVTDIYTSYYFGQPGNTLTVTGTTVTTNLITCSSTIGLLPGREVIFSGTTFGNIVAGTTYYVRSVDSLTQFTISTTPYDGSAVVLTTATGSMNCIVYEPTFYTSLTPGFARLLYPNSLYNMRNRVASMLGQEQDSRLLPLWMTSQQLNGSTLGYTQAWVIAYTKPGFADIIKTNIEDIWPHTLNQINFEIDRFSVDKSMTYNYDNVTETWDELPSATPTPDPLNSEDFYVLFPRKTILPNNSQ